MVSCSSEKTAIEIGKGSRKDRMNKEWSEKNKKMQTLIGKDATFREGIDVLMELRENLFQ